METSLLTTKLNIPPARPQIVARPRLIERLREGLQYNLILISAPAGFGKTTLVSEWARRSRMPAAWVSLDEGDNDPVRFWDYFIASIRTLQTDCGEKILPLLHSSQQPAFEPILNILINDLAGIEGDFVVVLDDYHLLNSPSIHDSITYLLEHVPPKMHLVIASRADPSLPLAHFRGRGTMLEIGADDLRFTLEDTASLLEEMKIPEISVEDVVALNKRTEGWVVGLKMAALSMRGQEDIPGYIAAFTGSHRYVMDYLMEEVLRKQSEEICDFLLKTSVLERLSGPLCDAVTGRNDSREILHNLERGQLFIFPLDESRQWYRCEHLFTDLLRHQVESNYKAEAIDELHWKASQWYENNSQYDSAIHHALAARNWDTAANLIYEYGSKNFSRGETVTYLNWTQQLPEEVLISQPSLCLNHISAMSMAGSLEAAELLLDKLEKTVLDDDILMGKITARKALIAGRRFDYNLTVELAKKALSLLPPDEYKFRGFPSQILGQIYVIQGKYQEAEPYLTEAHEAFQKSGALVSLSTVQSFLLEIRKLKGELHAVADSLRQALSVDESSPISTVPHFMLSFIFYEWNDLESAVNHVTKAIETGRLIGVMQARVMLHDELARFCLARGDEAGFQKALEKADFEASKIGDRPEIWADHAAYHVLFALRQDDLAAALKWGGKLDENADFLTSNNKHIPLRLLIAQGKKSEALDKLQVLYDEAVKSGMHGLMIEYRIYQALAAENEESAVTYLSEALTAAEPEGYIRSFIDEGKLLAPLLEKVISRGIAPEYAGRLLKIIQEEQLRKQGKLKKPAGISPDLLSDRELEVLRLLAEDIPNQRIAEKLCISLSTVKTHVHHIIEKLEVRDRRQAVYRARELKLL